MAPECNIVNKSNFQPQILRQTKDENKNSKFWDDCNVYLLLILKRNHEEKFNLLFFDQLMRHYAH